MALSLKMMWKISELWKKEKLTSRFDVDVSALKMH